ncbi:MAG: MATE family efflux transporter [Caulobacteraceae bacterium]|nr:MATE family efflux transporter [Caulobacteraceae bacterium]
MPDSQPAAAPPSAGAHARHARRNLTEGPITSTLLVFSLPVLGGNVLQTLNGTVNQFFVSHTPGLGVTAITALGNANTLMFLLMGAVFGISMASNILIAQAVGAGDLPQAKTVMGTAVTFFFAVSIALALIGWRLTPGILGAMHTPPAARDDAIIYLRIIFIAMPFMYFFMFLQMAQRGAGDSKTPFYFMVLAVLLEIGLNPCLIRGLGPFPRLGMAGSATATLVSQAISLVLLMVHLYRRRSVLMLRPSELHLLRPDMRILRALVLKGMPMGVQMLVMSGAAVVMLGFVNSFGALTAAAYAAASQVWAYVQMPGMAIGASVSSMAAQNIGAGRWDRVNRIAASGLASSTAITGAIAAVIYALGALSLFFLLPAGSPAIAVAVHINRMVLWSFVLFNATFALTGVVRSTGAVFPPLIILTVSMWLIRVPFASALTPHFGSEAIWWSFPLGTITSSVLTGLYFLFGGWRKARMLQPEASGQAPDAGQGPPAMDPQEVDDEAADALETAGQRAG